MAKVGSSAKFGIVVIKASILNSLGGPLAKEGLSAKYEHTSKFTLASQRSFRITYKRPISHGLCLILHDVMFYIFKFYLSYYIVSVILLYFVCKGKEY